jgi:hypothetical protein
VNKPVYASKHRMAPLVTTKIIRLGDSPIGTNPYATLATGETDCKTKEAMPMRSEYSTPANRRPLAALCVMLAVLSVFVGLAAILGPGRTIYQVGTYLIPMVVITGVLSERPFSSYDRAERSTEGSTTSSTSVFRLATEYSYSTYARCRIPGKPEKPPRQCIPLWAWPRPSGC